MFVTRQLGMLQSCLVAAVKGKRKLEAYATWGMLPACLPSHRQRVVPKQLTNFTSAQMNEAVYAGLMKMF